MIKQVIKQIWNERKSNAWLWIELLLVFTALWVIVDWTYVNLYTYVQPRGFNIENTYQLNVNSLTPQSPGYIPQEQKTTTDGEDYLAVLERLRRHPDIEYVSCSMNASPYNSSSSSNTIRQDSLSINRLRRSVTADFFNVFRYENADGSGSATLAGVFEENTFIVPSNLYEKRYPDGKGLLGQEFYMDKDSTVVYKVAAVTNPVRYADFNPARSPIYYANCLTDAYLAKLSATEYSYIEVCVRTRPGASPDFAEKLLQDSPRLYNAGNCYIQLIQPFDERRTIFQMDTVNAVKKRGFIMLFLLINIFLGIIGTFWYRTQQRRSELGLRIALGSSRFRLNMHLISEGMLLLLFAFLPALVICYNIGGAEVTDAWQIEWGMSRFIPGVLITLLLMLLMMLAGIWYPAHQAMKIEPAEALHEE